MKNKKQQKSADIEYSNKVISCTIYTQTHSTQHTPSSVISFAAQYTAD